MKIYETQLKMGDYCRDMKGILEKVLQYDDNNLGVIIDSILASLSTYGKQMPDLINLFGMKEHLELAEQIKAAWKKKDNGIVFEEMNISTREILEIMLYFSNRVVEVCNRGYHTCACCGEKVFYWPLDNYFDVMNEKYNVPDYKFETLSKEEYHCPNCMSSDRDRLIISFLEKLELGSFNLGEKLLQMAPATTIEKWIHTNTTSLSYETTDLFMDDVTFKSDIQDMNVVEDGKYDYVICSHILEHVQDDRKAINELKRIIKKDGFIIFLVPVFLDKEEIDEEWGLGEADNWYRFGQGDHCRAYSKNGLVERLEASGLKVHQLGKKYFGEELFHNCGLTDTSVLYVLTKKDGDIDTLIADKISSRVSNMKNKPLVSVIMSSYNHERFVAETIESVLNQTYENIEFLVADDASTDSTPHIIGQYEDRLAKALFSDQNAYGRIQDCFPFVNGDYIAIINSDDLWEPNKIAKQVDYLEANPDCLACFTGVKYIDESNKEENLSLFATDNMSRQRWMRRFFYQGNCLAHPSILIRKDVYMDIFSETRGMRQVPDWNMWVKLIQQGEIHIIPDELTVFRLHFSGDNPNTSAVTEENNYRTAMEEVFVWFNAFSKMDSEFFKQVFSEKFEKSCEDEIDIKCQKLMILADKENDYWIWWSAVMYAFEIMEDLSVVNRLREKYNFSLNKLHALEARLRLVQCS